MLWVGTLLQTRESKLESSSPDHQGTLGYGTGGTPVSVFMPQPNACAK